VAIERRETRLGEARYLVRIFRGSSPEGRRQELHKTFRTRREAARWETAKRRELDTDSYCQPTKEQLGSYMKSWLTGAAKLRVRPRTWEHYDRIVRREILPAEIAAVPLSRLTTAHLEAFYATLLADGLGARSVRYVHSLIHNALKKAARDRVIVFNPASDAELPRQQQREMVALSPDQAKRLIHVSETMVYVWDVKGEHPLGNRWHAFWHLLLNTGLRPSEALALRWEDVGEGRVHVRHSLTRGVRGQPWSLDDPKTAKSRRVVSLPPATCAALAQHRMRQEIEKVVSGSCYINRGFIFASSHGEPADLHNITTRHFRPLLIAASLPTIRVYDLRHTHATLMLSAGVPVKVVSERLGHASAVMTLNTYAHVLSGQQDDAVSRYVRYLASEVSAVSGTP
jgi:integrase